LPFAGCYASQRGLTSNSLKMISATKSLESNNSECVERMVLAFPALLVADDLFATTATHLIGVLLAPLSGACVHHGACWWLVTV